jgi:pimeloyl-ACP methyl ester carboxylesterase
MGELNAEDTRLFLEDRVAARAKCEQDRLESLEVSAEQVHEGLKTLLSPADAAVLTGELAQYLVDCMRSGLAPGAEGWWEDDVALMQPWGFELSSIRTPVLLYHGRQDRFVPFGHGEWLAGQIPGVQAELTDDDGHLTLTDRHQEQIHAWLLERLR